MAGKLYVCPTPIGNLEDITYRTLRVLSEVDLIAAEDTRHTIKLLNHFEINKTLTSYHEHNKLTKGPILIDKLLEGINIALVSDAGMPGISDPGQDLVALCIDHGIDIEVLPGASAFVIALVGSGLPSWKFAFEGFLDRDKKSKKKRLEEIRYEERTLIIYESPHRLKESLKFMEEVLGDRKIAVCRELTKKHEEYMRSNISEGSNEIRPDNQDSYENLDERAYVIKLMEEGLSKKDAIKMVAKDRKLKKDIVYKEVLDL